MMGRLTRDPEIRYSQGEAQSAVARFRLAVNRAWKREGEADADFFNCITFGPRAEFVERFLRQGTKIVIVGHIQNDNYTNREGKKVYATIIIVDEIDFAEGLCNHLAMTISCQFPIKQWKNCHLTEMCFWHLEVMVMQVIRVIHDVPVRITLTDDELFSVYQEQKHVFDVTYIKENLKEMLTVLKLESHWGILKSGCQINYMAEQFRYYQDAY